MDLTLRGGRGPAPPSKLPSLSLAAGCIIVDAATTMSAIVDILCVCPLLSGREGCEGEGEVVKRRRGGQEDLWCRSVFGLLVLSRGRLSFKDLSLRRLCL